MERFVEEQMAFVGPGADDAALIRRTAPLVLKQEAALTSALYDHFLPFPATAQFFLGADGAPDRERIERRKHSLGFRRTRRMLSSSVDSIHDAQESASRSTGSRLPAAHSALTSPLPRQQDRRGSRIRAGRWLALSRGDHGVPGGVLDARGTGARVAWRGLALMFPMGPQIGACGAASTRSRISRVTA
jgi:hypothetical protein